MKLLKLSYYKALLRDWLFADYKWITRAQVRREIYALCWHNRDRPYVKRQLLDLLATLDTK